MENETANHGDCIVFKRADALYDVAKINEAGKRVDVRAGLKELNDAYQIARTNLEGGRVLYSDHSTPGVLERLRIPK